MDIEKNMIIAGVPMEHKEEIEKSLAESKRLAKKLKFYKWSAPFVMLFIAPFLKWEYNKLVEVMERLPFKLLGKVFKNLPNFIDHYDNNISMNGDRTDWVHTDESGAYYRGEYFGRLEASLLNDQAAKDRCYYVGNKVSGRSKIARYVWLGLRNRASKYALDLGPEIDRHLPITSYIWKEPSEKRPGEYTRSVEFYTVGGIWQMRTSKVVINYFITSKNLGYKISNYEIDIVKRCMVVWKTFDMVRW